MYTPDTLTESVIDTVTNKVDELCENIMLFSPRGIEVGNNLDQETAYQIIDSLSDSYPRRFQFYVNDDVDNEGQYSIYARYQHPLG